VVGTGETTTPTNVLVWGPYGCARACDAMDNCVLREISFNGRKPPRSFLQSHHEYRLEVVHTSLALRATARAIREQPSSAPATVKEFVSVAGQTIRQPDGNGSVELSSGVDEILNGDRHSSGAASELDAVVVPDPCGTVLIVPSSPTSGRVFYNFACPGLSCFSQVASAPT